MKYKCSYCESEMKPSDRLSKKFPYKENNICAFCRTPAAHEIPRTGKTMTIELECGNKHCASEPGKFCLFLRTLINGKAFCHYFEKELTDKNGDIIGWLQRLPECLAACGGGE